MPAGIGYSKGTKKKVLAKAKKGKQSKAVRLMLGKK